MTLEFEAQVLVSKFQRALEHLQSYPGHQGRPRGFASFQARDEGSLAHHPVLCLADKTLCLNQWILE